jgi:hypothetical protein
LFLQSWSIWRRATYAGGSDEEKTLPSRQIPGLPGCHTSDTRP